MNHFKRIASLVSVTSLAVLAGCTFDVRGLLKVNRTITLLHTTVLGSKPFDVAPGTYGANVGLESYRKFVELQIEDASGHQQSARFKAPVDNIPTDGTWVEVSSQQSGQPYDVRFSVKKDVQKDPELHRDWESCTYERCQTVCTGHGQNQDCHQECTTYRGQQEVEYYNVHTYWELACGLGKQRNYSDASFGGKRHDVDRDYTYQGQCR